MSYTIEFREADGILICRMYGFLDEQLASKFGAELLKAQAAARAKTGTLLCLFDNRQGHVAAPAAARALVEQCRSVVHSGDRSAILVANSLNKMQAKRSAMTDNEIFVSENAAVTWLTAYRDAPHVTA
jgi:hypothetical protein